MPLPAEINVDFETPANAGVLRYLQNSNSVSVARHLPSCPPEAVNEPYIHLGTHPELVARLWDQLATARPVRCQYVVHGVPVLVRPDTGVLFAFAAGHMYALRLPPIQRAEMDQITYRRATANADQLALHGPRREKYLRAQSGDVHQFSGGITLEITTLGPHWTFGRWLDEEPRWCLSAFEFAV